MGNFLLFHSMLWFIKEACIKKMPCLLNPPLQPQSLNDHNEQNPMSTRLGHVEEVRNGCAVFSHRDFGIDFYCRITNPILTMQSFFGVDQLFQIFSSQVAKRHKINVFVLVIFTITLTFLKKLRCLCLFSVLLMIPLCLSECNGLERRD